MEKQFITPQDILTMSFELAAMVYESGYRPSHIIGVWRGGAPIAVAVHEGLLRLGCPAQHFVIQVASYGGGTESMGQVSSFGVEAVAAQLTAEDKLLIVDDIYDTGLSMMAILSAMKKHCAAALPREIKIATACYKPSRNQTRHMPDYYVNETDKWTVFPHELIGCSDAELQEHKALPERFLTALKGLDL